MSPIALTAIFVLGVLMLAFLAVFGHFAMTWARAPSSPQEDNRVSEVFADAIAKAIVKSIDSAGRDNRELTEIGFDWALVIALKRYWPDVGNRTAIRWLREYIGVPFGTEGYDWTVSAANTVAREYVENFGEAA